MLIFAKQPTLVSSQTENQFDFTSRLYLSPYFGDLHAGTSMSNGDPPHYKSVSGRTNLKVKAPRSRPCNSLHFHLPMKDILLALVIESNLNIEI